MAECSFCGKTKKLTEEIKLISTKKVRKLCSIECKVKYISKYHVGSIQPLERRLRVAAANSKPHTIERKRKISESRRFKFTNEELVILNKLLSKPYNSTRKISNVLNICKGQIVKYIKNIWIHNDNNKDIQSRRVVVDKSNLWNQDDILLYLEKNCSTLTIDEISKIINKFGNHNVSNSFCMRYFSCKAKRGEWKFHKGQTHPELVFQEYLDLNNFQYEYNKMVSIISNNNGIIYYSVDFVIDNLIYVEIQGDYWHGNPQIYSFEKLNGMQRSNMNRDKRKKAQILSVIKPEAYFQIWEYDINNNTENYKQIKNNIICILQKCK